VHNVSNFLSQLLIVALILALLWWLWRGLVGTWYILKYLSYKGLWKSTCLVIVLIVLFGWNLLFGALAFLVCLGPIAVYIGEQLWKREFS